MERSATVFAERVFITLIGPRKPNLVLLTDNNTYILDVEICSDSNITRLERPFLRKVTYYATDEFKDLIVRTLNVRLDSLQFSVIILSWRGLLFKPSAQLLTELGFSKHDLANLTLRSMEGSVRLLRHRRRGRGMMRRGRPPELVL